MTITSLQSSPLMAPVAMITFVMFAAQYSFADTIVREGRLTQEISKVKADLEAKLRLEMEERVRIATQNANAEAKMLVLALIDEKKKTEIRDTQTSALAALRAELESLPLSSSDAQSLRDSIVARIDSLSQIKSDTPKEVVEAEIEEIKQLVSKLRAFAKDASKRFYEKAREHSEKLKWNTDDFLNKISTVSDAIKKIHLGLSHLDPGRFGGLQPFSGMGGVPSGINSLIPSPAPVPSVELPTNSNQLTALVEEYTDRGFWTSSMLACLEEFAPSGIPKEVIDAAKEKHDLESLAEHSAFAMNATLQMAMMTGNPYIIGAAFIMAILSMIFGGGSGSGKGDGEGKGKQRGRKSEGDASNEAEGPEGPFAANGADAGSNNPNPNNPNPNNPNPNNPNPNNPNPNNPNPSDTDPKLLVPSTGDWKIIKSKEDLVFQKGAITITIPNWKNLAGAEAADPIKVENVAKFTINSTKAVRVDLRSGKFKAWTLTKNEDGSWLRLAPELR